MTISYGDDPELVVSAICQDELANPPEVVVFTVIRISKVILKSLRLLESFRDTIKHPPTVLARRSPGQLQWIYLGGITVKADISELPQRDPNPIDPLKAPY